MFNVHIKIMTYAAMLPCTI